jgi:cbb3-type cytochrome c oxidase subunit III
MRKIIVGLTVVLAFVFVFAFTGTSMATDGAAIFNSKCKMCHGTGGKGTAMAPKLAGNEFVKGDRALVVATVANGRKGDQKKYTGKFNMPMPVWGTKLSEAEIGAVVDYVRGL